MRHLAAANHFRAFTWSALVVLSVCAPSARAAPLAQPKRPVAPPSALQSCVDHADERVRSTGVQTGNSHTVFLLAGDSQVFAQRIGSQECVGFVAAGSRYVQSLEVVLQSPDGRMLAHSARPTTLAYALHCGKPGETVLATLRVLDGQGEVVFEPWLGAGATPPALSSLEQCPALGSPRPAPLDVGPEPPGQTIEMQLDAARAELAGLGYRPGQVLAYGAVRAGQHAANGLVLSPKHCYALVAVGSPEIVDLDLRVFGPTLPLTAAGADLTRSRAARVKLCAEAPARYVLDVSAFQGEGAYAVAALELNEPATVPGITGPTRISYAETMARMSARGMTGRVVTTGLLDADEPLTIPLTLAPGACYAVSALEASEHSQVPLQLGLKTGEGQLVALDTPNTGAPLLYHCAAASGEELQAVVKATPGKKQTRFVLLVGSDAAQETP